MNGNKIYFLWHQAWPHNDLPLLKTKVQLLHHTYLWPPLMWNNNAMDKGKIEGMATKFSEKFAIDMLKKHRRFCRRGFTHLDATPIFQKSSRYLWDTLYIKHSQDFMDSKGYQHVGTIEIDDIFLKKELIKKWGLSKMPAKKVGSMSCSAHAIKKFNFKLLKFA